MFPDVVAEEMRVADSRTESIKAKLVFPIVWMDFGETLAQIPAMVAYIQSGLRTLIDEYYDA